MRISDWSSDVCSSDLTTSDSLIKASMRPVAPEKTGCSATRKEPPALWRPLAPHCPASVAAKYQHSPSRKESQPCGWLQQTSRSEEHTSELQSLMRISYDVFCLKKKKYSTRLGY